MRGIFSPENLNEPVEFQIARQLRLLRESNHVNQQQVAQALHISRSSYAYYETGKTRPELENLVRLAWLYDVSLEFILGLEKDQQPGRPLVLLIWL